MYESQKPIKRPGSDSSMGPAPHPVVQVPESPDFPTKVGVGILGNGQIPAQPNMNGNPPHPVLVNTSAPLKRPRVASSNAAAGDATNGERLTSLSDRFSYRPAQPPASTGSPASSGSTLLARYSAMLDGNVRSPSPVNGQSRKTPEPVQPVAPVTRQPVAQVARAAAPRPQTRAPLASSEGMVVTQLLKVFSDMPPETVRVAVNVYKTYNEAASWLSKIQQRMSALEAKGVLPAQQQQQQPGHFTAKRQVAKPSVSIREKFSNANGLVSQPQNSYYNNGFQNQGFQPAHFQQAPAKPKRRLVKVYDEEAFPVSDEDSDEEHDHVDDAAEAEFELRLLEFLNTASVEDIVDISSFPEDHAQAIIESRPHASLAYIREVDINAPVTTVTKKRGNKRKTAGEKVVDASYSMLKGYEAVDSLIRECSALGDEVAAGIKAWGVDVLGAQNDLEITEVSKDGSGGYFTAKPSLFAADLDLKDYQQVGINWLSLLYNRGLSCILADEMGLGKTCQVIAFLAHLKEVGVEGPHLVVVPASTLENWLREIRRFCPSLVVETYYGSQDERANIRDQLLESGSKFDIMVTTYNLACGSKPDHAFLRSQPFNVCVYDEGHLLKNSQSERYSKLMRLRAKFRLLLTGTPLQNNLKELVSLLAFILPNIFESRREDLGVIFKHKAKATAKSDEDREASGNPLLSEQRILKAKTMMTPFVLRRKKEQVLSHLPEKSHAIEYCGFSDAQRELYDKELDASRKAIEARAEGDTANAKNIGNLLMQLRKASIHPLLFRRLYTDEKLRVMAKAIMGEDRYREANQQYIYEDMEVMSDFELNRLCEQFPATIGEHSIDASEWMNAGKVAKLEKMLPEMKAKDDRILIFSQFTQMLDILERVLDRLDISYLRLDGSTPVDIRQDMIDKFHDEKDITVFLLSTKAGGFGINLACANVVIIYDLSFNPHDDKQAEDRAHRVGQTRPVKVYRLITENSIEENILALANTKLALDRSVSDEGESEKAEQANASLVASMLFKK